MPVMNDQIYFRNDTLNYERMQKLNYDFYHHLKDLGIKCAIRYTSSMQSYFGESKYSQVWVDYKLRDNVLVSLVLSVYRIERDNNKLHVGAYVNHISQYYKLDGDKLHTLDELVDFLSSNDLYPQVQLNLFDFKY